VTVSVTGSGARPARADVRFELDHVLASLAWDVRVTGVAPSDVYAVVLRAEERGRVSVVARLSGPGVTADRGSLTLDDPLRESLEGGAMELVLVTRDDPFGSEGARVRLDAR
jgi:hypothetical protein